MREIYDEDGKSLGVVKGLSKSDQKRVDDGQVDPEAVEYFRKQAQTKANTPMTPELEESVRKARK